MLKNENPRSFLVERGFFFDCIELFYWLENQTAMDFASYRSAAPNVTSEPKRNGSAEPPETRKLYGTH